MKLAIVTGSNKGIGFEIARSLGAREGIRCVATARSEERGREAVRKLKEAGVEVEFHPLDITEDGRCAARDASQMRATAHFAAGAPASPRSATGCAIRAEWTFW